MVGLIIYEALNKKIFLPYMIGLPAYISIYVFYLFIINADQWRAFWWIVQPFLIRAGKYNIHRLVGKLSYLIMPLSI